MDFLRGKKTYLFAGLGALLTLGHLLGWVNLEVYQELMALLGFGSVAALRAGMKK